MILPSRRAEIARAYERLVVDSTLNANTLALTFDAFSSTFCDVLASAVYLPAAECFALVPAVSTHMTRGEKRGQVCT